MKLGFGKEDKQAILGFVIPTIIIVLALFLFLGIIWPLISGTTLFIPLVVCFLPVIPSNFLADELDVKNKALLLAVSYLGLAVTAGVYLGFFVEAGLGIKLIHLGVYVAAVYLFILSFIFDMGDK